jgi:hydrogenase maturation protease
MKKNKKYLFIGYGNPDRGDDGASYQLLITLLNEFGKPDSDIFSSEITELNEKVDILFNFQLLPEFAEIVANYECVLFIDAHTGEIQEDIRMTPIEATPQFSPFTHHFSPASCLALAQSIKGRHPKGWLISMRGYEFGFDRELTERTQGLVNQAFVIIKEKFLK